MPNNPQKGDRFKYLITAAFTDRGGGFNNQTILKENSYINMGVENIYTLPLNRAPYISGSVVFDGEAKDNKLILESNTKIDLHNSQYFSDE
ncbi:hypothetical protein DS746_0809 [Campylobacter jejuni]|nr:hypothetical protein DS746_0809 [Campylobacter jejuni]